MSPAMAALRTFVCALICLAGAGSARAQRVERRPVAVVNLDLSDTSAAKALADQLEAALRTHPDLSNLKGATDAAALKDPIADPDAVGLADARDNLRRAEDALISFNNGSAELFADEGARSLLGVTPAAAAKLYADLMFVRGQAFLADGNPAMAQSLFALVARLDASRTLDPARYLPEVVDAFTKAKATKTPPGSIQVNGNGDVWVDGKKIGHAPGGFSVDAGNHVVWLAGEDRNTGGERVVVLPGKETAISIPDEPVSRQRVVQRARIALATAPDATARAAAMNSLATLVEASDAVLLHVSEANVVVQTWHRGNDQITPGFSALRAYKDKDKPADVLAPLAPPKKPIPVEPPIPIKPVVVKKWYQRRPVQVGIVLGAVAAVVGIYFASQGPSGTTLFDKDFGIDNPGTSRK